MKRWLLVLLTMLVAVAFIGLLLVGYENVLALLRYRIALFIVLAPLVALFLWCVYKTFDRPSGKDNPNDTRRLGR